MAWYWWVIVVVAAIVLVRAISKSGAKPKDDAQSDELYTIVMNARQNAARRAAEEPKAQLQPELKPYLTRLCQVYATHRKTFASPDTRTIGQEIFSDYGHNGMLAVHEAVRQALGSGPARDLEYKWSGIGQWLG